MFSASCDRKLKQLVPGHSKRDAGAVPVDYKIHVTTADIKHAGTDDDCYIDIVGDKGKTNKNQESPI